MEEFEAQQRQSGATNIEVGEGQMMKCHVTDAKCETDANAEFVGKLSDDSVRLTRTVIDMLDLRMNLDDELLIEDATIGKSRKLIWKTGDRNRDADVIKFEFTE